MSTNVKPTSQKTFASLSMNSVMPIVKIIVSHGGLPL